MTQSRTLRSPDTDAIEVQQRISAPLDQVWKACASARGLSNWQADQAEGEARRGGTLTLYWEAFGASVDLDVVDLIPYERLVLRHGASVVELRFDEELVTLTHRGLTATDDMEGLRSSWQISLAQLAHSVERHPGRQRRVYWVTRRIGCSPQAAHLCFTDPRLLSRWLTEEGSVGSRGERYWLVLKSGQVLSGRVLAQVPGRDVALTCEDFGEAVLTLRTLPAPTSNTERMIAFSWSEWGRPRQSSAELREELADALRRLRIVLGTSAAH